MPSRCTGVLAAARTQGKRAQHGKPQSVVRSGMTGPTGRPRGTGRALWGGGEVRSTAETGQLRRREGTSVQDRRRTWRRTWRLGNLSTPHDVQKLPMAPHAKDGVRSCPRAGCGKSACPVVCPAKAGMFSRRKACRGKNQNPVVWIAGWRETKTLKPIDNVSRGEATSHRAVTTVNARVASKMSSPEGRAPNRRAKAAWGAEI